MSRVTLRSQATVAGPTVRVADVLNFVQAEPQLVEQVAEKPLFVPDGERNSSARARPQELTVTHDQIVQRLSELGVNVGNVLVGGAARCVISVRPAQIAGGFQLAVDETPESGDGLLAGRPASLTNNPGKAAAGGPRTLADTVRAFVDTEMGRLGGKGEVQFELGGQDLLPLTAPPFEFVVTSTSSGKLGLREFQVVIRRDGQLQRQVKLFAQVRLVRSVVIAKRPLNPGNMVTGDDVGMETRVFDQSATPGARQVGEVVGQQIKRFVPAGEMVPPEALKAGDLVVHSRPVTVLSGNGSVQVRLTGIALDSGGFGDTVRVRMGESRGRTMLHGVVTGLGSVRVSEGE